MILRPITPDLYGDMIVLQDRSHPDYLRETLVVLTSKVYVSPATCFAAQENGVLVGYILAHPYRYGEIPPLTEQIDFQEEKSNLHIHDCVVDQEMRGRGVASRLIESVEQAARDSGFSQISLVAVHEMKTFWSHAGWVATDVALPEEYLPACYMVKPV